MAKVIGTYNDEGENVDLYLPRKCSATNNLIRSYDHASVQIVIANVNSKGVVDGTTTTFCLSGAVRQQGKADAAINHLAVAEGIVRIRTARPRKQRQAAKGGKKGKQAQAQQQAAKGGKGGKKGAAPAAAAAGKPQGKKAGAAPAGKKSAAPARRPKA